MTHQPNADDKIKTAAPTSVREQQRALKALPTKLQAFLYFGAAYDYCAVGVREQLNKAVKVAARNMRERFPDRRLPPLAAITDRLTDQMIIALVERENETATVKRDPDKVLATCTRQARHFRQASGFDIFRR